MESNQEAANAANITTAKLTKWLLGFTVALVIIGIVTLLLMAWPLLYSAQLSQPSLGDERLVKGWTPIVVLASAITLSAISLFTVAVKRWRNKRLLLQVTALGQDLKECAKLRTDYVNAVKETNDLRIQKDDVNNELTKRKQELDGLKTLRDMRSAQAKNIKGHIIITHVNAGDLILDLDAENEPCVTVGLKIRNESLFNISIPPKDVKGSLFFANRSLAEPIRVINDLVRIPIEDLEPFAYGYITLLQPLRVNEIERIQSLQDSPSAKFGLGVLSSRL
ncbi:MAG TPA: hypothetical protein VJ875_14550 [Pyrinomonadaceae bacterium]|nr:hypothetical protein [Pyrinomonadaceae bacterium]